ncbi:hypothetical protein [Lichenibacterium dinghuense]|uniref:hypothetical protein n=1 Tax=Lichenibacterium dinghuense TaxID=2895977 RepID=UPI001F350F20|nr:hypothetical protein [Lichenibacterium sp. 6Y81]
MNRFLGPIGPAATVCVLAAALGGCQNPQPVGSLAAPGLDASPAAVQAMEGAIVASFAACKGERHFRTRYVPQIKISLDREGAFAAPPVLVNPSNRREDRRMAEAALVAVNRCNPVTAVRSYQPYYQYWHEYVLDFAPS